MKPYYTFTSGLLALQLFAAGSAVSQTLTIQKAAQVSYPTEHGVQYQIESSPATGAGADWKPDGPKRTGDGETATHTFINAGAENRFYRVQSSGTSTLTEEKKAQINAYLSSALTRFEIPGIIAGVKVGNAQPWITAHGVSNMETKEALGTDYRFRIGSASKTFVAMTILQLISQGKLQLDEPISPYLSQAEKAALSKYNLDQISVRMLLEHTSGIQNYTDNTDDWFIPYITDRTRVWTDLELLQAANAVGDPYGTPGALWWYSNSNYILLGIIAQKITGSTIRENIISRWIQPLQLTNTIYPAPGESQIPGDKASHGYMDWQNFLGITNGVPAGFLDVTVYDPSGVGAAGPMISTCDDLLRWVYAVGHGGNLIGDLNRGHLDWKYFRYLVSNGTVVPLSYGMGIAHENDPNNNADYYIVGHRGQISGFDTAMQFLPDQNTAIVVVCNRSLKNGPDLPTNSNLAALNYIVNVLFPELIQASQTPPTTTPGTIASSFTSAKAFKLKDTKDLGLSEALRASRGQFRPPLAEYR